MAFTGLKDFVKKIAKGVKKVKKNVEPIAKIPVAMVKAGSKQVEEIQDTVNEFLYKPSPKNENTKSR